MNGFTFSESDEAFRAEVRAFLDAELTDELRAIGRTTTGVFTPAPLALPWHRILYRRGWIAPTWPQHYGGTGWTVARQYIFAEEAARAEAPVLAAMSLRMVGPVIQKFGTEEQKAFYLPRILSGEDFWCQGYSEPESGSDLASLRMRAASDGDFYVLDGAKIWTTHAQWANRMFCLVRTSQEARPQQGITFLLVDMATPGITVRPIVTLAGEHEVNQVIFDAVRVPKRNALGREGQGWTVAKALLEHERGGTQAPFLRAQLAVVRRLAGADPDPAECQRLAQLETDVAAYETFERRVMAALSRGESAGPVASVLKLRASELLQELTELGVALAGYGALAAPARANATSPQAQAMARYLNGRAWSIFGGTSEVQRQLIGKAFLGLP